MPFQTVRTGMPVVQASAAISTGTGASEEKIGMALVGVGESRGPGRRHVVNGHRQRQTARLDFTRFGGPNEMCVDEVCAETLREFQHHVGAGRWIIEHVGEIGEIFRLGKSEPRGTAESGDTNAHVLAVQFLREITAAAREVALPSWLMVDRTQADQRATGGAGLKRCEWCSSGEPRTGGGEKQRAGDRAQPLDERLGGSCGLVLDCETRRN